MSGRLLASTVNKKRGADREGHAAKGHDDNQAACAIPGRVAGGSASSLLAEEGAASFFLYHLFAAK
jgi:hypothetical protein